ncbi:VOC family protein [Allomeiothermus silvanus]|uniref:VOC family protein n=1 Tax=Allomeiothermus silvanus TaxID=52022 RepID=UPI0023F25FEB|nr:VOC family protein [Allomeiothermus silvanus]
MNKYLSRVSLYTPDLEPALEFYRSLGLEPRRELPARKGHRAVELGFSGSPGQASSEAACLILHDDPRRQFTDLEIEVEDVRELYKTLKLNPAILWLELPGEGADGWRATLRGPDGNVLHIHSS